jgi:phenylalanyl-tRNA synthetase alpha chain
MSSPLPFPDLAQQAWVLDAELAFAQAKTPAELENAKAHYLGKTGVVTQALKNLSHCSLEEKKKQGAIINQIKQAIETALNARRQALAQAQLEAELATQTWDVTLPGRRRFAGSLHPVCLTLERIETIFTSWGFDIAQGPEIESDWFNFTALNTTPDHPARSMHDTFYVEGGYVLRTHTSPLQIRYVHEQIRLHQQKTQDHTLPTELRVIAHGRTYRVDSDATHSPMFHQCEGLWLAAHVNFADLKSVFTSFCYAFFETDALQLRFRQSFFPFTEPSAEIDLQFQTGPLAGRWLEVAGAGQVHPQVIRHMGLDPQTHQGFAFGVGADRLTMLRDGVDDLRLFFDNDLRFLSRFGQTEQGCMASVV